MMKQYQLWYDAPAKDWNIALPLGNGRMGAMVFGGTVLERISLNEDSCWYGGFRDRVNPDAKKYLPVVRQLLKADRIAEAQQLAEEALTATPDGERHYEVLCDLILQQLDGETPEGLHGMRNLRGQDMSRHERPVSGYRRALDITDGVHQVSYVRKEKQIRRECFLSVPHQVFAMHHEGFSSRVLLRRGAYVNRIDKVDEHTILLSGQAGDGGRTVYGNVPRGGRGRARHRQYAAHRRNGGYLPCVGNLLPLCGFARGVPVPAGDGDGG